MRWLTRRVHAGRLVLLGPKCETGSRPTLVQVDSFAVGGLSDEARTARTCARHCRSHAAALTKIIDAQGPTECTLMFSPQELLRGTVHDVQRLLAWVRTDADSEYLLTDALDDMEVELFGGSTFSVTTLSSLVHDVLLEEHVSATDAAVAVALTKGHAHVVVAQCLGSCTDTDVRSALSEDVGGMDSAVRLRSLLLAYLDRIARPLLAALVAEQVDVHLHGTLDFATTDAMDASDNQTQMLDTFVAALIERLLSPSEATTRPIRHVAMLLANASVRSEEVDAATDGLESKLNAVAITSTVVVRSTFADVLLISQRHHTCVRIGVNF
eukprot:m.80465 g.80465  ORF g.80465 m.80465 type:complete len:326 (-) comp16292_c0_seq12:54-1031(-)